MLKSFIINSLIDHSKLIKKPEDQKYIYHNFLSCAQKLNEYNLAIKQLDKLIEDYPSNFEYKVDKAILLKQDGLPRHAPKWSAPRNDESVNLIIYARFNNITSHSYQ